MIYVCSDLHGRFDLYTRLLDRIQLRGDKDCLVVLGDVVDRGPDGVKILSDIMQRENVILLLGNHEAMMLTVLETLSAEITEESLSALDEARVEQITNWLYDNGGKPTLDGFLRLPKCERAEMLDYLACLSAFEEVTVHDRTYVLVHTGMGAVFSPEKPLEDYDEADLLWTRLDYDRTYYPDKIIVSGHTPIGLIAGNPNPQNIFRANNHIAVDCGACFCGRLGAICLETGEEIYVQADSKTEK